MSGCSRMNIPGLRPGVTLKGFTMKRQKHYANESEVLKDIGKANRKIEKLSSDADLLDRVADHIYSMKKPEFFQDAEQKRKEASSKRRAAYNLKNNRLKNLSGTLASVRTVPMEGILGSDTSVVLQR